MASNIPVVGGLLDEIPGVQVIEHVIGQLDDLAKEISKIGDALAHFDVAGMAGAVASDAHHAITKLGQLHAPSFSDLTTFVESTVFKTVLTEALGLNADKIEQEAPGSVKTIDDMIGFAIGFPLIFAGMQSVLKFFGAQRVSDVIGELFGKLPEELGVNWAIGMFMDRSLEAAIGNKYEEAIMRQKRPNAPDWRVVRLMLKQHLLGEKDLTERMQAMGFSDDWIGKLKSLGEALIPVGDLQQMWLYNMLDKSQVLNHLDQLGFRDEDAKNLATLYIDKAQTTAGVQLRAVARELFREQLISQSDYEQLQVQTNMPTRELLDDLKAIGIEQTIGRIRTPVGAIKIQYQHGVMVPDEARQSLIKLGYTPDAAADLLKAWDQGRLPHPMSAAKVLTYWYSGVITSRDDAHTRLVNTGLRPADADFLLDHPPAAGARKHALTPALVTQAFLDGVIQQDVLKDTLVKAGMAEPQATYQYEVALFKKSRQKRPAGADIPLTAGEVARAFKVGIFDPTTAQTELEKLGYSSDNALVLLELENKGQNPFQKGGAPAFSNLGDAIAYLEAHGYEVHPPPDPQLVAAEQMLLGAGWTFTPGPAGIATLPGGITGGAPFPTGRTTPILGPGGTSPVG